MSLVDDRGRLFGRLNLVDAAALAFVVAMVPVGYGAYLLFRPAKPVIESVTRVEIGKEERRIAGGSLVAKFKIKGSGLSPLMRAWIGTSATPALGLVFENANSADLMVGVIPAGRHDLILVDGVQEVARAAGAIVIEDIDGVSIRLVGWLTALPPATAAGLAAGFASPKEAPGAYEIVAVGETRPARSRLSLGTSVADRRVQGLVERELVLTVRCDSPASPDTCAVNGTTVGETAPVDVNLAGGVSFRIHELLPIEAPIRARAQVRFTGPQVGWLKTGDRDALLDPRRAELIAVGARESGAVTATVELGVDDSREGWRYRGQLLRPGAELTLTTVGYEARGQIISIDVPSVRSPATP